MGSLTETLRLVIDGTASGAKKALTDLRGEADKTDKSLGGFGQKMNTAANYAAGAATVLTGVIVKSVATLEKQGSGIAGLKRQIDITTEGASLLSGQFQRYGLDATTAGTGVKKLAQAIDEARNGNDTYAETFERLGISVDQLKTMSDTEAILATRDALAEMGAGADRTNVAVQLLGRGATQMSAWYNTSVSDMAHTNEVLKDSGMVWSDEELDQYKKAMQAQREMQIALTGIQLTIARDVLPALTPLIQQFGALLRTMRPFMGVIVPLTAGLWAFSGAVKGVRMVQMITGLGRTRGGLLGVYRALRTINFAPLLRGMSSYITKIPALIAANAPLIASFAVVAAGIYAIVKAYEAWQEAAAQAKAAAADSAAADQGAKDKVAAWQAAHPGQPLPAGYQKLQDYSSQNPADYQAPSSAGGWMRSWYDWMSSSSGVSWALPGLASGGTIKARRGGTPVVAAEAGEDEDFVPASKRRAYAERILGTGGTSVVFDFSGARFGPGLTRRDVESVLNDTVVPRILDSLAVPG